MAALYSIRVGADLTEGFINGGFVAIGTVRPDRIKYFNFDIRPFIDANDRHALFNAYEAAFPDLSKGAVDNFVRYYWEFTAWMRTGDIVLIPDNDSEMLGLGEVSGDFYYEKLDEYPLFHRRAVNWEKEMLPRSSLPLSIQRSIRTPNMVYRVLDEVDVSTLFGGVVWRILNGLPRNTPGLLAWIVPRTVSTRQCWNAFSSWTPRSSRC